MLIMKVFHLSSIVYGHPTGMQYPYNVVTLAGTLFYRGDLNPSSYNETLVKGAFKYDFSNYDYDYFSILIRVSGTLYANQGGNVNNVSVQFAENNCQNVGAFSGGSGFYSFICRNYKVDDYLNIYSTPPADRIMISAKISFYDDITTAKLDSIEQLQQQQNQFIQNLIQLALILVYGSVFNESVADTTGTTALFSVLQKFYYKFGFK